jgi:hypothetical protein
MLILIPVTCGTLLKVVSGKLYYKLNEFLKVILGHRPRFEHVCGFYSSFLFIFEMISSSC